MFSKVVLLLCCCYIVVMLLLCYVSLYCNFYKYDEGICLKTLNSHPNVHQHSQICRDNLCTHTHTLRAVVCETGLYILLNLVSLKTIPFHRNSRAIKLRSLPEETFLKVLSQQTHFYLLHRLLVKVQWVRHCSTTLTLNNRCETKLWEIL